MKLLLLMLLLISGAAFGMKRCLDLVGCQGNGDERPYKRLESEVEGAPISLSPPVIERPIEWHEDDVRILQASASCTGLMALCTLVWPCSMLYAQFVYNPQVEDNNLGVRYRFGHTPLVYFFGVYALGTAGCATIPLRQGLKYLRYKRQQRRVKAGSVILQENEIV
jgi:hypothetical protein